MKFIYPHFLFALFFILIPVIIHLFSFRRHKVIYFSNVRFLKDVKQQTKTANKLKHLLVLFSRIFFISFFVLAFAQPFIPSKNEKILLGEKAVSVYIDNSFSMEALSENGTLLALAKNKAQEIVKSYGNADKFQLLTNNFEAKHQRLINKEEFLQYLEEVNISPAVKNISNVISRQTDLLNSSNIKNKEIFLLSDFQKTTNNFDNLITDSSIKYTLVPIESNVSSNIYIDSIWFESPVRSIFQPEKLFVKVVNKSGKTIEDVPLKLTLNQQTVVPASFTVQEGGESIIPLIYNNKNTGYIQGTISINDYPVVFDDDFYFTYTVSKNIPVMAIYGNDENKFINALFANDSSIVFTSQNEKNIDYSLLTKHRFIILYDVEKISSGLSAELKRFVEEEGGYLLLFPSEKIDVENYNLFLSQLQCANYSMLDTTKRKVNFFNNKHRIFSNVFDKTPENINMPTVSKYFPINRITRSVSEELMKLNNGTDFILEQKFGKGSLFLSAVPLSPSSSNFSSHAIFVPTLYNMALNSQPSEKLYYTIGNNQLIEISQKTISEKPLVIRGNNKEIIPGVIKRNFTEQLQTYNHITEKGFYSIVNENDTVAVTAYNYSRSESNLATYTSDELKEIINKKALLNFSIIEPTVANITKFITEKNKGISLWKLCIILALVFITTEIALLKFWK